MTNEPRRRRLGRGWLPLLIIGALAFGLGYSIRGGGGSDISAEHQHGGDQDEVAEVWTCSMHPNIRQPNAGQCPICGMDLIPVVEDGGGDTGIRELSLSPTARKLAEIQVTPVTREFVTAEIRMVGKIDYDETRVRHITAWVPGRLDRLFVDFTGVPINKGDHLVSLYSPELLSAQQELIQALEAARELEQSQLPSMRLTGQQIVEAVREKLRLWGLTEQQIHSIEESGVASDHITIYAPMSGIVIHKNAVEGMYVQTGTRVYTIADLSRLWIKLDAYESDLAWIHYGQEVELETEAYPGTVFRGMVSFVDPILDSKTRTVKVRVNVDNPDGKLKPEMFVRARILANLAEGGKIQNPDLAGRWICPMHPEVLKDEPNSCDVCGMDLVSTESLGYVSGTERDLAPLVIPATAPLITGKRAVVYVRVPDREGVYEGREITLGPRARNHYIVRDGLTEGEQVVSHGAFKIDSAVQILAKPSMMNPEGGGPAPGHQHGEAVADTDSASRAMQRFETPEGFRRQLDGVVIAYLDVHAGLSQDDHDQARRAGEDVLSAMKRVEMSLLDNQAHAAWMSTSDQLIRATERLIASADIAAARADFEVMSRSLIDGARRFGTSGRHTVLVYHCPMAFGNRGADWIQDEKGTENPYFGSSMFRCGDVTETISTGSLSEERSGHDHH